MSLKLKYFSFVGILHILITILLYLSLSDKKIWFLLSESILLISLYLSYQIYKSFIYPIELMRSGKIAIQEEDFTIKYTPTNVREIDSIIEVYNEMIDQLRKEKTRTIEQSYFLENLINHSPIGMIIMDYDQSIQIINLKAKSYFQVETQEALDLSEINHPLAEALLKIPVNEERTVKISQNERYKCRINQVIHKGFPRQFILIEDLTQEILQAEKEAYGKVIRMMAHEVNNSMGAVNSILNSVHDYGFGNSEDDQEMQESLKIAIHRNEALAMFTDNFAEIIRLPNPNLTHVNVHDLIQRIIRLFQSKMQDLNIQYQLKFDVNPLEIQADVVQLEQAISNILKNSIEAIGRDGNITIQTSNQASMLRITDDGEGISQSIEKDLFTPFFSTKTNGQGIGLMLIRDILNAHDFSFKLYTDQQDSLTYFDIRF